MLVQCVHRLGINCYHLISPFRLKVFFDEMSGQKKGTCKDDMGT